MHLEEIEGILAAALPMRTPSFPEGTRAAEKIPKLEDYMMASAQAAGELCEARHWLRLLDEKLRDDWTRVAGYEIALPSGKSRDRITKADVQAAKITVAPQLYDAGKRVVSLMASVEEQIARFEREEKVVSRCYTMITGGS